MLLLADELTLALPDAAVKEVHYGSAEYCVRAGCWVFRFTSVQQNKKQLLHIQFWGFIFSVNEQNTCFWH